MNGLILAAGLGTRFRPHTLTLPKPAIPFLNIPLLNYAILNAEKLKAEKIFINTHHLPKKIQHCVYQIENKNWDFEFSHEPEVLGSAGGIGKLRHELSENENFFVTNADTIIIPDDKNTLENLVQYHQKEQPICTLLVMNHPEAGKKYGAVWADKENRIIGFGKTPPRSDCETFPYHFVGMQIINKNIFKFIPDGKSETFIDVLPQAFKAGHIAKVYNAPMTFFDGGSLEEFLSNTKSAIDNFASLSFLQEAQDRFGKNFSFSGTNYISESATLGANVRLEEYCVLGDHSNVGSNSSLNTTVLGNTCEAPTDSNLKEKLIL